MEFLQDILRECGPVATALFRTRFYERRGWNVLNAEKDAGFQLVTHGRMVLRSASIAQPITLRTGDVVVFLRSFDHEIGFARPIADAISGDRVVGDVGAARGDALAEVISGGYGFRDSPMYGLSMNTPAYLVLRSIDDDPQIRCTVQLISSELEHCDRLTDAGLCRLLVDLFMGYALSFWQRTAEGQEQRVRAITDPSIYRALELLHGNVRRRWTLNDMARESGLSRPAFLRRFRATTGNSPQRYLAGLRMGRAKELLRSSNWSLLRIASEIGYGDAFSLSKSFKRMTGVSPKAYRMTGH